MAFSTLPFCLVVIVPFWGNDGPSVSLIQTTLLVQLPLTANSLYIKTIAGANASANLNSLIKTIKASGIERYAYLKTPFTELRKAGTLEDVEVPPPLLAINEQRETAKRPRSRPEGCPICIAYGFMGGATIYRDSTAWVCLFSVSGES
jgi:hypothetical protein